jgi:uncharacterized protein YggE
MNSVVTQVSASGSISAEYDLVNVSFQIQATEKTSSAAKDALRETVNTVLAAIEYLQSREGVTFNKDRTTSGIHVNVNRVMHENKWRNKGFIATYSYSCQSTSVDKIGLIMEHLAGIDNVQISNPVFKLSNATQKQEAALRVAADRTNARFVSQCRMLGKNPDDYEIIEWNVSYDESQVDAGPPATARAFSASPLGGSSASNSNEIQIQSGKARITATLTVGFGRKR